MPNHKPERTCIACRSKGSKENFVKIIKNKSGEFAIERDKKLEGRGAYVCKSKECFEKAVKQRQLERALETRIDEAVFSQLMEEIDVD